MRRIILNLRTTAGVYISPALNRGILRAYAIPKRRGLPRGDPQQYCASLWMRNIKHVSAVLPSRTAVSAARHYAVIVHPGRCIDDNGATRCITGIKRRAFRAAVLSKWETYKGYKEYGQAGHFETSLYPSRRPIWRFITCIRKKIQGETSHIAIGNRVNRTSHVNLHT